METDFPVEPRLGPLTVTFAGGPRDGLRLEFGAGTEVSPVLILPYVSESGDTLLAPIRADDPVRRFSGPTIERAYYVAGLDRTCYQFVAPTHPAVRWWFYLCRMETRHRKAARLIDSRQRWMLGLIPVVFLAPLAALGWWAGAVSVAAWVLVAGMIVRRTVALRRLNAERDADAPRPPEV